MSKNQKVAAERKHKMVHNFLVESFPGCDVEYNGVEGFDHEIVFNGKATTLETKTCRRFIRKNVRFDDNGVLNQNFRLGRFRFNQRCLYPYVLSQHGDLIKHGGWYIFVVGNKIFGVAVWDVDREIGGDWETTRLTWDRLAFICFPDWLSRLKKQVYGIE